ncbi:MAG: FKBP-type peptidyl-prolyl cis-trans isomerase [Sedimentisphaerales bacterium]|nr:FKBP-type peptidyl-prolyl cis-trans isomerase [Sedimentisphaerales bacterium]
MGVITTVFLVVLCCVGCWSGGVPPTETIVAGAADPPAANQPPAAASSRAEAVKPDKAAEADPPRNPAGDPEDAQTDEEIYLPPGAQVFGQGTPRLKPDTPLSYRPERDRVSYIYGTRVARNFRQMEFDVDLEWFLRGIQDVFHDKPLALSEGEMRRTILAFEYDVRDRRKAKAQANAEQGQAFLATNRQAPGVTQLASGLQYQVLQAGTGPSPRSTDQVSIRYRGTLLDGTEFDRSDEDGTPSVVTPAKASIKGWAEALPLMKEGARWKLFIPSQLAYGQRGTVQVPPNAVVIYEIELVKVGAPAPAAKDTSNTKDAEDTKGVEDAPANPDNNPAPDPGAGPSSKSPSPGSPG